MLEDFVHRVKNGLSSSFSADAMKAAEPSANGLKGDSSNTLNLSNFSNLPDFSGMTDQELAVWYNDNVIYPDKVRLNCYYYRHYSFLKDIEMIFATVLGWKIKFAGEEF